MPSDRHAPVSPSQNCTSDRLGKMPIWSEMHAIILRAPRDVQGQFVAQKENALLPPGHFLAEAPAYRPKNEPTYFPDFSQVIRKIRGLILRPVCWRFSEEMAGR